MVWIEPKRVLNPLHHPKIRYMVDMHVKRFGGTLVPNCKCRQRTELAVKQMAVMKQTDGHAGETRITQSDRVVAKANRMPKFIFTNRHK